jgi:hypothetical protein
MTRPLAMTWRIRCWILEKSFILLEGECGGGGREEKRMGRVKG